MGHGAFAAAAAMISLLWPFASGIRKNEQDLNMKERY